MAVDIIVAIILLLALVRGWMKGFLYQLGHIALAIVAFLGARALAPPLVEPLVRGATEHAQVSATIAFFIAFGVLWAIGAVILWWLTRDLHRDGGTFSALDRTLGLLLSGAKTALLIYVAFVAMIMLNQLTGAVPVPYASSATGRWVMRNNFLESEAFPRGKALVKLGWLLHNVPPDELAQNPHFMAIVTHPKADALRTPEVADALFRQDWVALLQQEALWDLLDEPDVQDHLNAIEWSGGEIPGAGPPPPTTPELPAPPAGGPGVPFKIPDSLLPGVNGPRDARP